MRTLRLHRGHFSQLREAFFQECVFLLQFLYGLRHLGMLSLNKYFQSDDLLIC